MKKLLPLIIFVLAIGSLKAQVSVNATAFSGTVCAGGSDTLYANASGVNPPFTYSWSTGSTFSKTVVNPNVTTTYTIVVQDAIAATASAVVTVTVPSLNVNIAASSTSICAAQSVTLSASGASTYFWSTGSTNSGIVVNPSVTTSYSVNGSSGCSAGSATQVITVNPPKNISGVVTSSVGPNAGIVTLYKFSLINDKLDSIGSANISAGNYSFTGLAGGSYIVKASLTDTMVQETYGLSSTSWQSAAVINQGCVNNSTQNINVVPLATLAPGPGILSGKVVEGLGYVQKGNGVSAPGNPIKGISVKGGRNPGGEIVAAEKTSATGGFTFTSFPVNGPGETYFLLIDIPGLDTNSTYHVVISPTNTAYTNLDFVVDSAKVNPVNAVGIKEMEFENGYIKAYPNPTSGKITLKVSLTKTEIVEVDLMDIRGRIVKQLLSSSFTGQKNTYTTLNLAPLEPGIYFIRYKIGEVVKTDRIILTD